MQLTSDFPRRCAVALVLLLLCVSASAEELSFVPSGETKPEPYLIEKPASIERGKRHPLIVYLHGRGHSFSGFRRISLSSASARRSVGTSCSSRILGLTIG